MSGPGYHSTHRFKIASQLGGFKDTVTLTDPFGTGARFVIHRNGSNAHRQWFKDQIDTNPITLLVAEEMLADDPVVLTAEEQKDVEAVRIEPNETSSKLLPIIDRLVDATVTRHGRKSAMRRALREGHIKPSEVTTMGFTDQLEEALFALKDWQQLPGEDEEGNPVMIPYSLDAARELLMNDTPLTDCGMDDLILGVDAWTMMVPVEPLLVVDGVTQTVRTMLRGLTIGNAYQLWILRRSKDTALFKSKVVEAAAKNSSAPSEISSSSGGATSSEAPASS